MSDEKSWYEPDELFGPGPSALVALVLAFLVLMGGALMVNATVTFFGQFPGSTDWGYTWATFAGLMAPALASAFLARRAITSPGAVAWELAVGRTALVLAVIGAAYAVLLTLGMVFQLA